MLQSRLPATLHWHLPCLHVELAGHACPQPPQLLLSVLVFTQVPLHMLYPALQVQVPHLQLEVQVWVPWVEQVCVVPGAHPWFTQLPQTDQVPLLQLAVWVPQFPQVRVGAVPEHPHVPLTQEEPAGQQLVPQGAAPPGHRHIPPWQVV